MHARRTCASSSPSEELLRRLCTRDSTKSAAQDLRHPRAHSSAGGRSLSISNRSKEASSSHRHGPCDLYLYVAARNLEECACPGSEGPSPSSRNSRTPHSMPFCDVPEARISSLLTYCSKGWSSEGSKVLWFILNKSSGAASCMQELLKSLERASDNHQSMSQGTLQGVLDGKSGFNLTRTSRAWARIGQFHQRQKNFEKAICNCRLAVAGMWWFPKLGVPSLAPYSQGILLYMRVDIRCPICS